MTKQEFLRTARTLVLTAPNFDEDYLSWKDFMAFDPVAGQKIATVRDSCKDLLAYLKARTETGAEVPQ